jgi:group I intron endonuclease
MSIGIYKITSPSGKIYIGQSVNIEKRFESYRYWEKYKDQTRLYNSFFKYGYENHVFEIIEECSVEQLDEKELYWGNFYNVLEKNGLNCRLGHSKGNLSEETKQKISKSLTGKKQSEETIQKRSQKIKGQKRSEATKKLMRESKKGIKITWGDKISEAKQKSSYKMSKETAQKISMKIRKPILQYDIEGNFIQEFDSAKTAQEITGIKFDNISMALRGKSKTAGGYVWKYKIH